VGVSGTVKEIGLFTSRFKTPSGLFVVAPNSSLCNSIIINYFRNSISRIDRVVGISYADDLIGAMAGMLSMMNADARILEDPPAAILVTYLAYNSANLTLISWDNLGDYWVTLTDLTRDAKLSFDEKDYSIPYPQSDVHML
jgi:small conductance mechanosensitive channel